MERSRTAPWQTFPVCRHSPLIMLATKLHYCKNAVTISKYNKAFLLHKYGDHLDHKIHIIHCGVNVEVFRPVYFYKVNWKMIKLTVTEITSFSVDPLRIGMLILKC